jgi:molybdenum cofactor synthesis domain-containing protein
LRISVITVSDRAFRGEYEDLSGPEVERAIAAALSGAEISREVAPDEEAAIMAAFDRAAAGGADWIVTTGGTGPGPRDRTPEATRAWIDRELPGIAEALRSLSLAETVFAALSRALAGMKGSCIVVNLPGSPAAARLGASFLVRIMEHGTAMARGEGHGPAA